jgi:hypothetical protein
MNHVLHQHPFTPFDQLPSLTFLRFVHLAIPEEILPIEVGNQFRHRMGTKPLETLNGCQVTRNRADHCNEARTVAYRRDEVVGLLKVETMLPKKQQRSLQHSVAVPLHARGIDALVEASLLVADDIVVMQPKSVDGEQQLVVVAGVVCSPSRWSIQTKLGSSMMAVHAPVPQYAEHVGKAVDTTLPRLRVDQPMVRSNWTIEDHLRVVPTCCTKQAIGARPNAVMDSDGATNASRIATNWWFPMFTIRTYQQPITEYVARGKDVATTLYSLVKRLPDDVAKYKSLLHYREAIACVA